MMQSVSNIPLQRETPGETLAQIVNLNLVPDLATYSITKELTTGKQALVYKLESSDSLNRPLVMKCAVGIDDNNLPSQSYIHEHTQILQLAQVREISWMIEDGDLIFPEYVFTAKDVALTAFVEGDHAPYGYLQPIVPTLYKAIREHSIRQVKSGDTIWMDIYPDLYCKCLAADAKSDDFDYKFENAILMPNGTVCVVDPLFFSQTAIAQGYIQLLDGFCGVRPDVSYEI